MPRWLATACLLAACTREAAPALSTPMQVNGDACGARFERLPGGGVRVTNGPQRLCALSVSFRVDSTEMAFHSWSRDIDVVPDGGLPAGSALTMQPPVHDKAQVLGHLVKVSTCTPCP
jgi:hypothetical protein